MEAMKTRVEGKEKKGRGNRDIIVFYREVQEDGRIDKGKRVCEKRIKK